MDGLLNESDFDILGSRKGVFLDKGNNNNVNPAEFLDSLNFSESGNKNFSKGNSRASPERNQFTLGPQGSTQKMSKFNSYSQQPEVHGIDEDNQILDESLYEESK